MKYFLIIQDSIEDSDPAFRGPFDSVKEAQSEGVEEFSDEPGRILTVLSQSADGTLLQAKQAHIPGEIVWK